MIIVAYIAVIVVFSVVERLYPSFPSVGVACGICFVLGRWSLRKDG